MTVVWVDVCRRRGPENGFQNVKLHHVDAKLMCERGVNGGQKVVRQIVALGVSTTNSFKYVFHSRLSCEANVLGVIVCEQRGAKLIFHLNV